MAVFGLPTVELIIHRAATLSMWMPSPFRFVYNLWTITYAFSLYMDDAFWLYTVIDRYCAQLLWLKFTVHTSATILSLSLYHFLCSSLCLSLSLYVPVSLSQTVCFSLTLCVRDMYKSKRHMTTNTIIVCNPEFNGGKRNKNFNTDPAFLKYIPLFGGNI